MKRSKFISALWVVSLYAAVAVCVQPLLSRFANAEVGDAQAGAKVFDHHCAFCHGAKGFGDGPAADLFDPRPRDFRPGLFKLRSTQTGELPTDDDLIRTVTNGMPGTGMPSFRHLGEKAIRDVVAFVKTLGGPEGEEGNWFELYEVPPGEKAPAPPPVSEELLKKGAELYVKVGCDQCHGKTGKGDGKKPEEMLDNWGHPLYPRSFEVGVFKGGNHPEDLYMRILTGLDGTPMTGFWKEVMTPEERWAIVYYVLSFAKERRDVQQASRGVLKVTGGKLADSIDAPVWKSVEAVDVDRLALKGGWMRQYDPISIKAVRDGDQLGLLMSWDDGENTCPKVEVYLPPGERERTFDLGTKGEPAYVWRWKKREPPVSVVARGPGWEKPNDAKIVAKDSMSGTRMTLLLEGPLPPDVHQLLVTVAGCKKRGDFLTATAYNALQ